MSKVANGLYLARKKGEVTQPILITFATQEYAEAFDHPYFHAQISVPLGDEEWCLGGNFRLDHLEDLEEVETILSVQEDPEMQTMPVGGPIEF